MANSDTAQGHEKDERKGWSADFSSEHSSRDDSCYRSPASGYGCSSASGLSLCRASSLCGMLQHTHSPRFISLPVPCSLVLPFRHYSCPWEKCASPHAWSTHCTSIPASGIQIDPHPMSVAYLLHILMDVRLRRRFGFPQPRPTSFPFLS